jgi:hypothetical protein
MFQSLGDFIPSFFCHFHELPKQNDFDFFEQPLRMRSSGEGRKLTELSRVLLVNNIPAVLPNQE